MLKLFIVCLLAITSIQLKHRHDELLDEAITECMYEVELQYKDEIGIYITESEYNELFIECSRETKIY